MAQIEVIQPEQATGELKAIYDNLIQSRGKLAEVHKIQSLRPKSIVKHMELYMEIMFSRSELSRAEREMIAVVVSVSNNCSYCQHHHAEALNNYWKNDAKLEQLKQDFTKAELSEKEELLCHFAKEVTVKPEKKTGEQYINELKKIGVSDSAILDMTLVVAYFNFVNRIVLALDVSFSEEEIQGYNY